MRVRLSWPTALLALVAFLAPASWAGTAILARASGGAAPGVSVTPDGDAVNVTAHAGPFSVIFDVTNTGTASGTYSYACSATNQATCGTVTPASHVIPAGATREVTVTFSSGNQTGAGKSKVILTATGPATDTGEFLVTVGPSMIQTVLPGGTAVNQVLTVRQRQPVIRALFLASAGYAVDTTTIGLTWQLPGQSVVTVTTEARYNRGLLEWEPDSSLGLVAPGDQAQVVVTMCTTSGTCTTESRYVKLANDSKPLFGFSGVPTGSLAAGFGAPFGPGFSVSGPEVGTGFGTVPYFSMGAARSAGLVYSTRQAWPRATIPVDVDLHWLGANPQSLTLIVYDGVTFVDSVRYTSPNCMTGSTRRCRGVVTADFRGTSFSTPTRKWLQVEAKVVPSGGGAAISASDSVEVALVDRRTTRYGAGWWPAGALRLVAAGEDRLLVGADGAVTVFRGNGDSLYLPPPGNFSVLKKVGSTWELSPRGSLAKLVFDTQGRLIKQADQNGNRDTLLYGGTTDSLLEIKDPLDKRIVLGYASGKLTSFTSLYGTGQARSHAVVIDGSSNQLTRDSIGGSAYRTVYSYATKDAGSKTYQVATRLGLIQDTTRIVYDSSAAGFTFRPGAVQLPRVPNENGTIVVPQINYIPVLRRGAGTVVPLDSTGPWVELRDPKGNWTRSYLDRWGSARFVWDTLGALSRSRYTADGRVLWSQGKLGGDTTRTYFTYDALRRLAKSWINRVENGRDTLRLDSLAYDANHRVVRRIDSRGKVDSLWYDAKGNLIKTRDPGGFVTQYWYSATTGQLDSLLPPSTGVKQYVTYDATWKNPWEQKVGTELQSRSSYDSYGRVSATESRIKVRIVNTTTKWQWRKSVPTYITATNEVTGQTLYRSDTCDPCTSGPSSYPADTLHTVTTSVLKDMAGRDTARVNERGYRTGYTYDRLGRLLARRPPSASSPAPRDSMLYDVAGNVVKTFTRRGDTITATYDTRNRLLTQVVPGVGTINRSYAGPLDQLTRTWVTGAVDSIGGVNGEVRTGYDSRGRVKADTVFRDTTAIATSYAVDIYERDSSVSDPLGNWFTRYDATRGTPERLVTPFSDSLALTLDGQYRPTARTVLSSGPSFVQSTQFLATSGAARITHEAGSGGGTYEAGTYDPEGQADEPINGAALGPLWVEQHGTGATPDSLVDSLNYDGWGRMLGWRHHRKAGATLTLLTTDSVWFDRTGNVHALGETRTYELQTDRLLTRSIAGDWSWTYSYDAAGNLTQAAGTKGQLSTTWTYGYDALNQLRSVRKDGTLVARYGYDVLGRRIARKVYAVTLPGSEVRETRYLYQGGHVGAETDAAGNIKWKYTWGPGTDNLIGLQDSTGTQYYVVQDQLGSVRGLVKRDGTWIMHQRFTPYGALLARDSAGSSMPKGFHVGWTGREYDAETGFTFHRARYYSPDLRRWTQEDPIGYAGGGNLYAYVGGAVMEARDPSGLIEDISRWGPMGEGVGDPTPTGPQVQDLGGGGRLFDWVQRVKVDGQWVTGVHLPLLGWNERQMRRQADRNNATALRSRVKQSLTGKERAALGNFCDQVDCDRVRIHGNPVDGAGLTIGYDIWIGDRKDIPLLAHEMVHVAQYEDQGIVQYLATAALTWLGAAISNTSPYPYGPLVPGRSYGDYNMEQQGAITQVCFASGGNAAECRISPFRP